MHVAEFVNSALKSNQEVKVMVDSVVDLILRYPDCADFYAEYGMIVLKSGDEAKAKSLFLRAVLCSPDVIDKYISFARENSVKNDEENSDKYIAICINFLKLQPENPALNFKIIRGVSESFLALGKLDACIQVLLEFNRQFPDNYIIHKILARAYIKSGNYSQGIYYYKCSISQHNDIDTVIEYCKISVECNDFSGIQSLYQHFLRIYPFSNILISENTNFLWELNKRNGWFDDAMRKKSVSVFDVVHKDIRKNIIPKPIIETEHSKRKIHFVSYSNYTFGKKEISSLVSSAISMGGVSNAFVWNSSDLMATDFYDNYKSILNLSRGGGYWIWKPYLIFLHLLSVDEGDVVFYHDSGRPPYEYKIERSLEPAIEWMDTVGKGMLPGLHIRPFKNSEWTKRDCFVLMGCDSEEYWAGYNVQATWSFWRKEARTLHFLEKWLQYCVDPRAITDYPNVISRSNLNDYTEHRHDQSILSLLTMKEGVKIPGYNLNKIWADSKNINIAIDYIEDALKAKH